MSTHIVAGLEITYGPGLGTTLDWLSFVVQHLKSDGTTKVRFSKRTRLFRDPEDALKDWLNNEWIRSRLTGDAKNMAPFFSDKPLVSVEGQL